MPQRSRILFFDAVPERKRRGHVTDRQRIDLAKVHRMEHIFKIGQRLTHQDGGKAVVKQNITECTQCDIQGKKPRSVFGHTEQQPLLQIKHQPKQAIVFQQSKPQRTAHAKINRIDAKQADRVPPYRFGLHSALEHAVQHADDTIIIVNMRTAIS